MKLFTLLSLTALVSAVVLMGCGRTSELEQDQSAQLYASLQGFLGSDAPLADPDVQDEMRAVTSELQHGLLTAVLPEYEAVGSKSALSQCKPKVKIVMVGIGVEFTPSSTCKLSGTVNVKLFPLTTNVDLDVVGTKFVDRLQLDAAVVLNGNKDSTAKVYYQNAQLSLKGFKLLPFQNITSSGIATVSFGSGFKLDSRVNAFDATSRLGMALIAKSDSNAGVRILQSCLLTSASGTDPTAGSLGACFNLGGGN